VGFTVVAYEAEMIPLIESDRPMTHMVSGFCEIRVPECEVEYFEENPADLGMLVLEQWSRCAVVVAGIIFDNVEEDDEEDW